MFNVCSIPVLIKLRHLQLVGNNDLAKVNKDRGKVEVIAQDDQQLVEEGEIIEEEEVKVEMMKLKRFLKRKLKKKSKQQWRVFKVEAEKNARS